MHSKAKVWLEEIIKEIGVLVSSKGFETSNKRERVGKYFELRWIKEFGWKKDIIRCLYPAQYLDHIVITVAVALSFKSHPYADETTIEGVGLEDFLFPRFLLGLRRGAFAKKMAKTVNRFFSWFEGGYGDPEKCIRVLNTWGSNYATVGSETYKKVIEYLIRIQGEENKETNVTYNLTLPEEVHKDMIVGGLPQFQIESRTEHNPVEFFRIMKSETRKRFVRKNARAAGVFNNVVGKEFERFLGRTVFENADKQVRTIGKFSVDFFWKGCLIEVKTSTTLTGSELEQLDAAVEFSRSTGNPLEYFFLKRPTPEIEKKLKQLGVGIVYFLER